MFRVVVLIHHCFKLDVTCCFDAKLAYVQQFVVLPFLLWSGEYGIQIRGNVALQMLWNLINIVYDYFSVPLRDL